MSKYRLPTELSLDELLGAIKGQEVINENIKPSFKDPIVSFIQAFNITPGKELVSDSVLHRLFKMWHKDSFIDKKNFNFQLGKYIPSEVINRRFYKVNNNFSFVVKKIEDIEKKTQFAPTKYKGYTKHFDKFLEQNKLAAGNLYVESDILYYVYNRWCDEVRRKKPLGYLNFISFCELNFESKRLTESNVYWFGLNNNIKNLITRSEVDRWRQGRAKNGKKDYREKIIKKEKTIYPKKTKQKK